MESSFESLDLKRDWADLPSRATLLKARATRELDAPPPPDVQPKWDIPDLIAITTAVSGRIVREAEGDTPASYPVDFEGFQAATIEVLERGACGVHIDFGGLPAIQESGLSVSESYQRLIPAIREATPMDCVFDCNVLRGENFAENVFPLSSGLAETVPMAPNFPRPWMEAVATVVADQEARLFFSIHSTAEVDLANRYILQMGLAPKPSCWLILIGYPYDDAGDRLATFLANPRAMLTELMQIVDRIREIDDKAFITVCAAGRAGHYLATAGMLLGLHVRVGTEDTVYRYPHRDEIVESNGEMVDRVVATAKALGRIPATAAQYREMIGLKPR